MATRSRSKNSLEPVLSALGARHVLAGVSADDDELAWSGDAGAFVLFKPELSLRLNVAVDRLLALLDRPTKHAGGTRLPCPAGRQAAVVQPRHA